MHPKKTRIRLRIHGRVQGVGFRWWARQEAVALGLAGRVRNRSDGTVEVEAEGGAEAVASLRSKLERGPSSARVERVEEGEPGTDPLPRPFGITS